MSKAFDSMYPDLLIEKLKQYGFSSEALQLLKSYFEGRQNRVKLGETRSDWKRTDRGCLQGSPFGPLLWNIFQNDLQCLPKVLGTPHEINEKIQILCLATITITIAMPEASPLPLNNVGKCEVAVAATPSFHNTRTRDSDRIKQHCLKGERGK